MSTIKVNTVQNSAGTGGTAIQGTNTNDNATAGAYGEYAEVQGSQTALTTTASEYVTITGALLSLTAGDYWMEYGVTLDTNTNDGTGANFRYHYAQLYDNTAPAVLDTLLIGYSNATLPGSNRHRPFAAKGARVSISSSKTIVLRVGSEEGGSATTQGAPTALALGGAPYIKAWRRR